MQHFSWNQLSPVAGLIAMGLLLMPLMALSPAPTKPKRIGGSIGASIDKRKTKRTQKKKIQTPAAGPRILSANLVEDGKHGLIWQRCSYGQKPGVGNCSGRALRLSYFAARAHCLSRKHGSRKFRLPTLTELKSLLRKKTGSARGIDAKLFPDNPPGTFWTDTTFRGVKRTRYVLDFHHSTSYPIGTENNALVRCVSSR